MHSGKERFSTDAPVLRIVIAIALSALAFTSTNGSTFMASIEANGRRIDAPEPSRDNPQPTATNDSVVSSEKYDANGQFKGTVSSGGTDSASAGAQSDVEYISADDTRLFARGLPLRSASGSGGDVATTYSYPSANEVETIDARGIVTRTVMDDWQRPVHVWRYGPDRTEEERYEYYPSGCGAEKVLHARKRALPLKP